MWLRQLRISSWLVRILTWDTLDTSGTNSKKSAPQLYYVVNWVSNWHLRIFTCRPTTCWVAAPTLQYGCRGRGGGRGAQERTRNDKSHVHCRYACLHAWGGEWVRECTYTRGYVYIYNHRTDHFGESPVDVECVHKRDWKAYGIYKYVYIFQCIYKYI